MFQICPLFFFFLFLSKFAACVHAPVVFAAYKADVAAQKLKQQQNEKLDPWRWVFSVCPSSLSHHTHTHIKIFPMPCVSALPDMWKRGKQRWRAWWRSVQSCGWWRYCKARSRTWQGTDVRARIWKRSYGAQNITLHQEWYSKITIHIALKIHIYIFYICEDSVDIIHFQAPYPGPNHPSSNLNS